MPEKRVDNMFLAADIVAEYEEASKLLADHEKAKWASETSMMARFALAERVLDFAGISSWLDVGCGAGAFQLRVKTMFPSVLCTGIDLSPSLIRHARERAGLERCRFFTADFNEFAGEGFDALTCIGVLQRTNITAEQFMHRAATLLSQGGRLFLDTKNRLWEEFSSGRLTPDAHLRWFDPEELRAEAEGVGFRGVEVHGFDPTTGKTVSIDKSHTIYLIGTRGS